jgi:hypothetical protein
MWNLPNPFLRKVRKNKGAKRGPRVGKKTLRANPFAPLA